jgi:hypothetical protein
MPYHESGLKMIIDTKAYLIGEKMKYNFGVKHNIPYTAGALSDKTVSILKMFVMNIHYAY